MNEEKLKTGHKKSGECQEICVSNFIKLSKNYRNDLYRVYIGHFIFLNIFGFLLKIYHPSLIDS